MGILDRLFRVGKAEANAVVDKMEDPVKMSQQILRDLEENRQEAINGAAEIKAMALQHRASENDNRAKSVEYENKATQILDRVDTKAIDEATGNKLATECLANQQTFLAKAEEFKALADREEKAAGVMSAKIDQINQRISETKNKAEMIASRAKTANAEEKINKTLSSADTDGLMQTLERMDEKTKATEFRAQAYAEIDNVGASTDEAVNKILKETSPNAALEALKAKRNAAKTTA